MSRFVLAAMTASGLVLALATAGHAASLPVASAPHLSAQQTRITPVYYVWNHHRYYHRRWDKRHKRWIYY